MKELQQLADAIKAREPRFNNETGKKVLAKHFSDNPIQAEHVFAIMDGGERRMVLASDAQHSATNPKRWLKVGKVPFEGGAEWVFCLKGYAVHGIVVVRDGSDEYDVNWTHAE